MLRDCYAVRRRVANFQISIRLTGTSASPRTIPHSHKYNSAVTPKIGRANGSVTDGWQQGTV